MAKRSKRFNEAAALIEKGKAYTIEEALDEAAKIVGENKKITIIPDGISVIVR